MNRMLEELEDLFIPHSAVGLVVVVVVVVYYLTKPPRENNNNPRDTNRHPRTDN